MPRGHLRLSGAGARQSSELALKGAIVSEPITKIAILRSIFPLDVSLDSSWLGVLVGEYAAALKSNIVSVGVVIALCSRPQVALP